MHKQLVASGRTVYGTPPALFSELNLEFDFTLDPCSTHDNALCALHFTEAENGLLQPWAPHRVFMNPPYGRNIGKWTAKAAAESTRGALVVGLVPASTDTAWWHDTTRGAEIRFPRGRLRFVGMASNAPFPSAIVIWRPFTVDDCSDLI